MIRHLQHVLPAVCLLLLLGCRTGGSKAQQAEAVESVSTILTGTFDSRDQASADPEHYYEIRLVTLPIWPRRSDGDWLYVEQAAFGALDRPYRQRVYNIRPAEDGLVASDVYELPGDPLDFAGAWRDREDPFAGFGPEALTLREGCTILLRAVDGHFVGETLGDGCLSTLRGAAWATSEVTLSEDLITSWDRGWNAAGEQVWGATEGGYRFVRRSHGAPDA